jgi:hypothetical protein
MKIGLLIFLPIGICFGVVLNHYIDGAIEMRQEETQLEGQLAAHLALFQAMKYGYSSAAMSDSKVLLTGNIKTYQYYKKNFPSFGANNNKLQQLVEEAYEADPGAKNDEWPVPGVPTTIPMSTTNSYDGAKIKEQR